MLASAAANNFGIGLMGYDKQKTAKRLPFGNKLLILRLQYETNRSCSRHYPKG